VEELLGDGGRDGVVGADLCAVPEEALDDGDRRASRMSSVFG
jgi:hypothetical protein